MQDNSKNKSLQELLDRKKAIEEELRSLESSFEENISQLQSDVTDRTKPVYWIKKYPLPIVGVAALIGFLAGSRNKAGSMAGPTVLAAVLAALKTVAARKIVEHVVKIIEGEVENSKKE